MVAGVGMPGIGEGFLMLSDFRELSYNGPCWPCFFYWINEAEKRIMNVYTYIGFNTIWRKKTMKHSILKYSLVSKILNFTYNIFVLIDGNTKDSIPSLTQLVFLLIRLSYPCTWSFLNSP